MKLEKWEHTGNTSIKMVLLAASGEMKRGWLKYAGKWYYLDQKLENGYWCEENRWHRNIASTTVVLWRLVGKLATAMVLLYNYGELKKGWLKI